MQTKQSLGRTGKPVETVEYGGYTWRRYPEAKAHGSRTYFRRFSRVNGKFQTFWLHVQVWEDHYGPIQEGMAIHHKDGNAGNNAPDNLTACSSSEHGSHHVDHLDIAREGAADWHKSEQGRKWHRENGKATWGNREEQERVCEHCGKAFTTRKRGEVRYCSSRCRSYARKARGDDNEIRQCEFCGKSFTVNRYQAKICCTKKCAARLRWRRRKVPTAETCV